MEGPVPYNKGDAILSGVASEQWPVIFTTFKSRYTAVPPTEFGFNGKYKKTPMRVLVKQMTQTFPVPLSHSNTQLFGKVGDWWVQYSPREFGVVAADIFAKIYELID